MKISTEKFKQYLIIPNPSSEILNVNLRIRAGSNYEKEDEIGVAHILEHLICGSQAVNEINDVGGTVLGMTSRDDVLFLIKILNKDASLVNKFISEIFNFQKVDELKLQNVKKVISHEINRIKTSPEKLLARSSTKAIYPNTRMSHFNMGDIEDIEKITPERLLEFYKRTIKYENAVLAITGGDKYEIIVTAQKPIQEQTQIQNFNINLINFDQQNEQISVHIDFYGYTVTSEYRITASLVAYILNMHLVNVIKNKQGLAYNISFSHLASASFGYFCLYFLSVYENVEEIINITKRTFTEVLNNLDETSFTKYYTAFNTKRLIELDKPSARADFYSELMLSQGGIELVEPTFELCKNIMKKLVSEKPKITAVVNTTQRIKIENLFKTSFE